MSHHVACNLTTDLGIVGLQFRLCRRLYLNLLAHGAEFQLKVQGVTLRHVHCQRGDIRRPEPVLLYRNLVLPGHHVYKRILAGTVCILGCLTIGAFVTQDDRRIENRGAARVGDGSNYSP